MLINMINDITIHIANNNTTIVSNMTANSQIINYLGKCKCYDAL